MTTATRHREEITKPSTLTEFIVRTLKGSGYFVERNAYAGLSIYGGHPCNAEIIARNSRQFPEGLIVRPYWQSVSGSADEKFPHMVLTARECYELPSVIVYAGDGYRPEAIEWLRNEVDTQLVAVLHAEEFPAWIRAHK